MKALISNDDGINASGILAAKEAISDLADITIVAPSTQQSGIGRALTLFEPLRIDPTRLKDGTVGYSISGTPTDSVTLGIFEILEDTPDFMISGINIGHNTGKSELTTSGTVGAAIEAASYGIPSIAVSLQVNRGDIKFENDFIDIDFKFAKKILRKVTKNVISKKLPENVDLINLNIPAKPKSEKIKIVKLGKRMYSPIIKTRSDPRGKPYYWIDGIPYNKDDENTDGYCLINEGISTLTPISIDNTSNIKGLRNWID
ncbi:MAG: 5'/3'-nucleotidase SurE [Methanobacteriaceae archaeon]|jgi:5'-nucleotidase|nr:5'/3'-nucleotidase SurE [Methanobacteriaceae archaeon]